MNGIEEDEFTEFLGLPSQLSSVPPLKQTAGVHLPSEPQQIETELRNMDTTVEKETADTGYNDLFGELSSTPTLPFEKPDIERIQSLGHEPLFPDVDETKIQPTIGFGNLAPTNSARANISRSEEFTIVLDQSNGDPRLTSQGVSVADWVVPTGHTRRDPVMMRSHTNPSHSTSTTPRPTGLHGTSGLPHAPTHTRHITGPTGHSRSVRIPAGCNPDLEPEFPTRAAPDQALKLPGQTRVTPDEYKEFLGLGHGEIFNLDLDRVVDPPWRAPGADTTDFFNYGMNELTWKEYCKTIESHRQEFSMKKKIQTYESANVHYQQDPDLPPEVAAAIAADIYHARSSTGPEMTKALPIPVFQGSDDYCMRNKRGRDFRRPEVRYDPDVIVELAGGVDPSNGVNVDYGEDYVGSFSVGENRQTENLPLSHGSQETSNPPSMLLKPEDGVEKPSGDPPSEFNKKPTQFDTAALFGEDDFGNRRSGTEAIHLGDLAMGMDTEAQQNAQAWHNPTPQAPQPPPRPEFNRMYDPYAPHDMWRPVYPGRGWNPRGGAYDRNPSEFWNAGRVYGRSHSDGPRGRMWHPYGPRRPGRRPPPPRYYDEYRPPHPTWTRRDDQAPPMFHPPEHFHMDDVKGSSKVDRSDREGYSAFESDVYYRERDRRRHESDERDEDRGRSYARSRIRDYDSESRSTTHHRDRGRDFGKSHRREDYDDRHRDRRRSDRDRSSERDSRRYTHSRERSRARDRDKERSRRCDTSDSESESRHKHRSKDRN